MIKSVSIQNFKCFDSLELRLAPLTLLTGFNAAGKSTTVQSLLLLAQTLRSSPSENELLLNGPLVSLGSPGEVLNQQNGTKDLKLAVTTDDAEMSWRYSVSSNSARRALVLEQFHISGKTSGAVHPIESLVYLAASRQGDKNVFPVAEEFAIAGDCGTAGQLAPWNFYRFGDDQADPKRSLHPDSIGTIRREVNAWLSALFPGAEANVVPVPGTELVLLQFRTSPTGEWQRPANVGYGLSYAFPFLVAGLCSGLGRTIIVDSPEAHLHPKGQSQIGRFTAQLASAGQQLLIETHSDHFLNGVRLALRDGVIKPADVAIYFFSQGSEGRRVEEISLDREGNASNWPSGFFDQAEHDLAALAGWL